MALFCRAMQGQLPFGILYHHRSWSGVQQEALLGLRRALGAMGLAPDALF